MKKLLLLLVAATSVACSQNEMTDAVGEGLPIDFRTAVGTRTLGMTNSNISGIAVTAIDSEGENYFTDETFSKEESSNYFTSGTPYYWPVGDLTFYAYAPTPLAGADDGVNITNGSKTVKFTVQNEISNQEDFITATATGNKKANEANGVALPFHHRLSQIEIKAKNNSATYVYKVQGVRIAQPVSTATFDFGTSEWMLGSDKDIYQVIYEGKEKTLDGTAQSLMLADGDNAMLIPQQLVAWDSDSDKPNENKGAYLSVLINITRDEAGTLVYPDKAGEYGWAAVPIDTKWEAGTKYVYTLDFTNGAGMVDPAADPEHGGDDILGSPIKFTVTVDEWQPVVSADIDARK